MGMCINRSSIIVSLFCSGTQSIFRGQAGMVSAFSSNPVADVPILSLAAIYLPGSSGEATTFEVLRSVQDQIFDSR